jgi:hypothetical protein
VIVAKVQDWHGLVVVVGIVEAINRGIRICIRSGE